MCGLWNWIRCLLYVQIGTESQLTEQSYSFLFAPLDLSETQVSMPFTEITTKNKEKNQRKTHTQSHSSHRLTEEQRLIDSCVVHRRSSTCRRTIELNQFVNGRWTDGGLSLSTHTRWSHSKLQQINHHRSSLIDHEWLVCPSEYICILFHWHWHCNNVPVESWHSHHNRRSANCYKFAFVRQTYKHTHITRTHIHMVMWRTEMAFASRERWEMMAMGTCDQREMQQKGDHRCVDDIWSTLSFSHRHNHSLARARAHIQYWLSCSMATNFIRWCSLNLFIFIIQKVVGCSPDTKTGK